MDERICPGLDICRHMTCYHAKPHNHAVEVCDKIECLRPSSHGSIIFVSKTKPRCVSYSAFVEQKKKSLPKRRLRPCKEWEED